MGDLKNLSSVERSIRNDCVVAANDQSMVNNNLSSEKDAANPQIASDEKGNHCRNSARGLDENGEINLRLRSPICCLIGDVDTGKTKILECMRGARIKNRSRVTQSRNGAIFFPVGYIRERIKGLVPGLKHMVPGLLVVDTSSFGLESASALRFHALRSCDLAILVVDIMRDGLDDKTVEILNLLRREKTDFIVALNKVDKIPGWKPFYNAPTLFDVRKQQPVDVQCELYSRLKNFLRQFKERGLDDITIVPTSAISGEGIPNLFRALYECAQNTLFEKLMFRDGVPFTKDQCDIVLVKCVPLRGKTTLCGLQGPIVPKIRLLFKLYPAGELCIEERNLSTNNGVSATSAPVYSLFHQKLGPKAVGISAAPKSLMPIDFPFVSGQPKWNGVA